MTAPQQPHARLAGLDGLRAVAVLLVVVYHLFPAWLVQSGFIGVDVFFVISGFLITTLLLREHARHGGIRLRRFWTRRARRLLPALAVVVTVCATLAWLVGGDVLVGMGRQVAGAATFSYNWVSIADGGSYFSAADPEIFRNLWSLAVEEQFYVLWPLLLPLFVLLRRRALRVGVALLLAAASAAWAFASIAGGADLTRVYFGTDTHAFGLLIGVALAFGMHGLVARRASIAGVGRVWGLVVGILAIGGIAACALVGGDETTTFPTTSLVASALTAVAVVVAAWPGSWFGRALDVEPLRWMGERSYGIYLWHWPLVVLATFHFAGVDPDAGVPVGIGAGVFAVTLAAAAVSYRYVEQPIRRRGFRGSLRTLRGGLADRPARRVATLGAVAVAAVALGGTTAAVAAAPQQTSSQSVVDAGRDALADADAAPGASGSPGTPAASATPAPRATGPAGPRPPRPERIDGSRVTAVGDSVMLASAPALLDELPGIQIDAAVSRSVRAGADVVQQLADGGALRDYVVVGLGTNGSVSTEALQQIVDAAGADRGVVLVNAYGPRDWIPGVNSDLAAFAAQHPQVIVADWAAAIGAHPDLLAGDQIHPGAAGGDVFAQTVDDAVQRLEARRTTGAWAAERARDELLAVLESYAD